MTDRTTDERTRIGIADELGAASYRRDGTPRPNVTIRAVRVGGDPYVAPMAGSAATAATVRLMPR